MGAFTDLGVVQINLGPGKLIGRVVTSVLVRTGFESSSGRFSSV